MPGGCSDGCESNGDSGGIVGRVIQLPQVAVWHLRVGDVHHEVAHYEHQWQEEQGQHPLLGEGSRKGDLMLEQ